MFDMSRLPMWSLVLLVLVSFLLSGVAVIAEGKGAIAEATTIVEVKPEMLGPVLWPWHSIEALPIKSLNVTKEIFSGGSREEEEEQERTRANQAAAAFKNDNNSSMVYTDGELDSGRKDMSWNANIDYTSDCPRSALVNVTDASVLDELEAPECAQALVRQHGGFSIGLKEGEGSFSEGSVVLWLYIPADQKMPSEESNHTFYDMCKDSNETSPSTTNNNNDTAKNASISLSNDSIICPAVRLLAGPVGEDKQYESSPLVFFLHSSGGAGSSSSSYNMFNVPLLHLDSELTFGDWNKVAIPVGASGWGGAHEWTRMSLMPSTRNGLKFYIGQVSIEEDLPKVILSQSKVVNSTALNSNNKDRLSARSQDGDPEEIAVIDESQAKRLEEVAVHLGQQQQQTSSKKKKGRGEFLKDRLEEGEEEGKAAAVLTDNAATKGKNASESTKAEKPQQVVRYLYENSDFSPGVTEWSWLSNISSNHSAVGLCATLESFGGLSLKAAQAFAKASVIKFRIQTLPERFFINTNTEKVQPVLNIRLDATKEKYSQGDQGALANTGMSRPDWLTFYTSELIPLQYAVPSLVHMQGEGTWSEGILPLAGFGDHAWDRISFIDATGRGTSLCLDNVTAEYIVALDQTAPVSLGEVLNISSSSATTSGKKFKSTAATGAQGSSFFEDHENSGLSLLEKLCTENNSDDISCDGNKLSPAELKERIEEFKLEKSLQPNRDIHLVREFSAAGIPRDLVKYIDEMDMPQGNVDSDMPPPNTKEIDLSQNTSLLILLVVIAATLVISLIAFAFVLLSYKLNKDSGLIKFWGSSANARMNDSLNIDTMLSVSDQDTCCSGGGPERIPLREIECDFNYSQAIGVGSTCAVFKGVWRGQERAIKAIHWNGEGSKPLQGELALCREMEYLPEVSSPFVIKMKAFAHANDTTYLVLEYCEHGNLQSKMKKNAIKMDRLRALQLLRNICIGLQHLNEAGIAHRDVKSSNILLQCQQHCSECCGGGGGADCLRSRESSIVAKLGDLGVSKMSNDTLHQTALETFCGTPRWMAPERLMLQNSLSFSSGRDRCSSAVSAAKCDVYSFGILAWEVINFQITNRYSLPFDEYKEKGLGLFMDGEFNSYQDGTLFNNSTATPVRSNNPIQSCFGVDMGGGGIAARHNTFASDFDPEEEEEGSSRSWFEETCSRSNNNLRNNHSYSSYPNTSNHLNESDSELQFRISGLDHERSTMPQVVNSQIEALMAERDQRALLGGVGVDGDAPNNDNSKRTGSNVWNSAFETSLYRKIVMGKRPTIPDDCSSSLADLIQACWSGDPNKRPTFRDISKKLELQIQLE
jgi:serine/threonine protein kinase